MQGRTDVARRVIPACLVLGLLALAPTAQAEEGFTAGDPLVEKQVREGLSQVPALDAEAVKVQVRAGVVTLTGRVPSLPHRRLVGRLVRLTPGVKGVSNAIEVTPPESPRESLLLRIKLALIASTPLQDENIDVDVDDDGRVELEGFVSSEAQRTVAIELVRAIHGVTRVRSRIQVLGPIQLPPVVVPEIEDDFPELRHPGRLMELRAAARYWIQRHPRLDRPGIILFIEGEAIVIEGVATDPGVLEAAAAFRDSIAETAEVKIRLRIGG